MLSYYEHAAHQVRAIFEQFPWLDTHFAVLKQEERFTATVKPADVRTLEETAGFGPLESGWYRRRLFFFDRNGKLIFFFPDGMRWYHHLTVPLPGGLRACWNAHKSMEDAIIKIGEQAMRDCAYIVLVRAATNSAYKHTSLKLICMPENRTLVDFMREKEAREKEENTHALDEARHEIRKQAREEEDETGEKEEYVRPLDQAL